MISVLVKLSKKTGGFGSILVIIEDKPCERDKAYKSLTKSTRLRKEFNGKPIRDTWLRFKGNC